MGHPVHQPAFEQPRVQQNILDLGYFNSIQSLQEEDQTEPRIIDELIAEVKRAFEAQTPEKLGRVWTTLQAVLEQIMSAKGNSIFKLPGEHKQAAARRGRKQSRWRGLAGMGGGSECLKLLSLGAFGAVFGVGGCV